MVRGHASPEGALATGDLRNGRRLYMRWTHMVRLAPVLPASRDEYDSFDGQNVYCNIGNDGVLRAVGCNLKAPGQRVASWDPSVKPRGAFVFTNGQPADVVARYNQVCTPVKDHVTTSWATDIRNERLMCLPYRVKWGKEGAVSIEELPITKSTVTVRYK